MISQELLISKASIHAPKIGYYNDGSFYKGPKFEINIFHNCQLRLQLAMTSIESNKTLIYAPPHYVGNMGDRIVTKVLLHHFPEATFLYDNLYNYLFTNNSANKLYFNPRKVGSNKKIKSLQNKFSKFILLGMDGLDGFYNLRESLIKIQMAAAIAHSGGTSWIINFSWNNASIHESLLSALHDAKVAGVKFFARDSESSARLSVHGINAEICPDLGFLITENGLITDESFSANKKQDRPYAILAPSYTFGQFNQQVETFSKIALLLLEMEMTPVLYASVSHLRKSDMKLAKHINRNLKKMNLPELRVLRDEYALVSILLQSNVVVTGRMHVAIVALANLVPAYIFEYQGKSTGLLKDLGLNASVSPTLDITNAEFNDFVHRNTSYRAILKSRIPSIKTKVNILLKQIIQ